MTDKQYAALVDEWLTAVKAVKAWRDREMELRMQVAAGVTQTPVEGVNRRELADGRQIVFNYGLTRKLDYTGLRAATMAARDADLQAAVDDLVRVKRTYDLRTPKYKALLMNPAYKDFTDFVTRFVETKPQAPKVKVE